MLWAIISAIIQQYPLRLMIHVRKHMKYMLPCRDGHRTATWEPSTAMLTEITATSLLIMGNIHPNPSHLSQSPHVMAHEKHYGLKLPTCINHTHLKRNTIIFRYIWWWEHHGILMIRHHFDWNHNYISPDHGKHPSESSGNITMHLSESCARINTLKICKLQTAACVITPLADKLAA